MRNKTTSLFYLAPTTPSKIIRILLVFVVGFFLMCNSQITWARTIGFEDGSGFNPINQQTANNPAFAAFDSNWWTWSFDNSVAAGTDCTQGGNNPVTPLGPYTSTVNSNNYYYAVDGCLAAAIPNFSQTLTNLSGTFTVSAIISQPTARGVSMGVSSSAPTTISIFDPSHNLLGTRTIPANLATTPNTSKLSFVALTAPNIATVVVSGRPTVGCGIGTTQCIVIDDLVVYDQAFTVMATAGSGQSANLNTAFGTPLQATVKDSNGSPVTNTVVTFTAPASGASGTFAGGSKVVTATTDGNGIATAPTFTANGTTGTYNVTASMGGANSPANFVLTNTSGSYTYYLPFLANTYKPVGTTNGSFTTYLAFQNTGSSLANISLQYVDSGGNSIATPAGTCTSVALYGECIPNNPFGAGSRGAGILTSDQPLAVIVAEGTPFGGSAYAVPSGAASTLNAPFAFNQTFGNYSTQLTVFNPATVAVNVTVNFYDTNGQSPTGSTQTLTIGPRQSSTLDQTAASSKIPLGFNGWAQVTAANSAQVVAQVLEQNPSNGYVAIANASFIRGAGNTFYAPAIFNNAYGAFTTGMDIINSRGYAVSVTVSYYNLAGQQTTTTPFSLPPYGLVSIFQGSSSGGTGLPANGLASGFAGGAIVNAEAGTVVAVNEFGGLTAGGTAQSGTYLAAPNGATTVGLPVIANGGFGYTTGDTIFNVSNQPITGAIQYYNVDGTKQGVATSFNIPANASKAFFQGAAGLGLPSNFYGTAVVSVTSGPPNSLIVTTNAISTNFFYTFTEPNQ